ncbi:MAG: pyruvate, water dikinase [Deltaproteobacteria bacterium]|nr:pyruvate, water dikinase [Deltaproteobacteria bacterium]MBW2662638.1 pyruvate, water dikinase [Deltaproteobacteria bacterium]
MFELMRSIKRLFLGEKQEISFSEEFSDNASFKTKYWNFKSLLDINNTILEIMSEMELALRGNQRFGMEFVRASCTSISVNTYKLIEKINDISGNRYETLYHAFADIQYKINQILEEKGKSIEGELVLSIEEINKDSANRTGSKMANLGEIMSLADFNVPHGFVVTSSAYNLFLDHGALQKKINQQLQSIDIKDMIMLGTASSNIQKLIIQSPVPIELERAILNAYRRLEEKTEKDVKVSMRSSALGEDSEESSFAGQYHTELNVSYNSLIYAYKKVLAGKYSPQAITYRFNKGFRDEDILMCVGCMPMVEAVSSGVMYSKDPGDSNNSQIVINAVPGLGKSVVDGSISPDLFIASREPVIKILKKEINVKDQGVLIFSNKKLQTVKLPEPEKYAPAITDIQARFLAKQAIILEKHFKTPQDIEWAIEKNGSVKILQSRPLKQIKKEARGYKDTAAIKVNNHTILNTGVAASPGVACGPAFILNSAEEIYKFPRGAVLVTKNSLPQWAVILNRAVAVVTDRGGIAGHLATVSREFGIPALFDTLVATDRIKNKAIITVDAYAGKVYEGKAEALLRELPEGNISTIKGSPVYITLKRILKHITPLNLIDPKGNDFTPDGCNTYHDITRFCHEKAVKEMFDFGKKNRNINTGKRLVANGLPTQWMLIDLGDGLKGAAKGNTIGLESIASAPMLALWEGITAVEWEGPPPVDTKGLMSIMLESTMNRNLSSSNHSNYSQNNCAIISKNFCNLSCRFGYHYSVVQTFISDEFRENYIKFCFKGGAADLNRKLRRMQLIKEILGKYDFQVQIHEDYMNATIERYDEFFLIKRLKMIGYLTMHTRQLDMIMGNPGKVAYYKEKMLNDISEWMPQNK